ncbi:UvrD-helicase domain-containing protein [Candidatus Woesearchaeota archaeon]|nr:UvrD-helicase domain-containing protein [Candidatus Woesearchaeota archaeon]
MAELDYLLVLKALRDIPFGVGKKLLIDFLQGNNSHESIERNNLSALESFGSAAYKKEEIAAMIDRLLLNGMIGLDSVNGNKFWKVMELTAKGKAEIDHPTLYKKKAQLELNEIKTVVTEQERKLFDACRDFLAGFNDEQKKAIINNNPHILCIAGAGSGKTTVLAKRIEFLIRYRSIDPRRILAITFTRKARQDMMKKLAHADVMVETFNSFCEKILKQHNDAAYGRPVRVMSYRDKLLMFNRALSSLDISIGQAIELYFSAAQKRSKTDEQLASIFMNDCFFIRDYFKAKGKKIEESSFEAFDAAQEKSAEMLCSVCSFLESAMLASGLRDFADQLVDTLSLFEKHKEMIPHFDYVLIDEYQDVNASQVRLIDYLGPQNIFAVGDPRQSIYGWRGSDIRHILNFKDKYPGTELIVLTKNYRSTKHIVELINKSIKPMGLADLESCTEGEKNIRLEKFDAEQDEFEFIIGKIQESSLPRNELFVLARTNRQLNELSALMKSRGIKHIVRSDELKGTVMLQGDDVTLATIHAIKGLEAHTVFVMGCTPYNFPCRGSEHPGIEMINVEEYDQEEEERRLLYVAMSRAKNEMYLTYSSKTPTSFITDSMMELLGDEADRMSRMWKVKTKYNLSSQKENGINSNLNHSFSKDNGAGQEENLSFSKENGVKTKVNPLSLGETGLGKNGLGENGVKTKVNASFSKDNGVISRLKEWRSSLSREQGVPAYVIMHDRTIIDLAMKMPLTLGELDGVVGIGPAKIAKFGEELLDVIHLRH